MLRVQRVIKSKPRRIYVSAKIGEYKIGFTAGIRVNLFQKNDTLFFSLKNEYPGFIKIGENRVYYTQKNDSVCLPSAWIEKYLTCDHVRVNYTKQGIFVRPFKGMDGYELN